ncbi:MAG: hypothetical protein HFI13_15900 [Lachnospiraceae bacterium]|nr:hypothetical protein [Lachnospiraceae bacterium]
MKYNIRIYKKKDNIIFYLLGLVSTFQLLEVGGITVFTLILLLIALKYLIQKKKFPFISFWHCCFLFSLLVSMLGNFFITSNFIKNIQAWRISSLKGVVIIIAMYFTYDYLAKERMNIILIFFRGVYHSCVIQLVWCYFQYILFKFENIDLNNLVFNKILHIWNYELGQVNYSGQYTITGMHSNAGILAPVLIFVILLADNIFLKFAALLIFFIAGNSTLFICGIIFLLLISVRLILHFCYDNKIKRKYLILFLLILLFTSITLLVYQNALDRVMEIIKNLFIRLNSIRTKEWTDGSTFAHYRYYASIPYIFSQIGIIRILIGFGYKCGGVPFVVFFNQYPDVIYNTESDPVSLLYGTGLIGLTIFYSLLYSIIKKGANVDYKYALWGILLTLAGIFYGMQLNWVLFVEWIMIYCIKNNIKADTLRGRKNVKYDVKHMCSYL